MPDTFESLRGQLLLDSGQLSGSFFHRSVVLICQHDPEGAFGLVLNRTSENKVGDVLLAALPDSLKGQALYLGGPVAPNTLSYLHTDTYLPQANVMANLDLGHAVDNLIEIGEGFSITKQIKVFAGYAGWGSGQLEDEIKRKAWVVNPASIEVVFAADPAQLWRQVLRTKSWQCRLLAEFPDDLSWN